MPRLLTPTRDATETIGAASGLSVIGAYWNLIAPDYDRRAGHGLRSWKEYRAWREILEHWLPRPPARVLDAGTGTGFLAKVAASLGHDVIGIDLAAGMLLQAVARADLTLVRRSGSIRVERLARYAQAEAAQLPFAKGYFDAVISRHVLWTLPAPLQALREWIRVCSPGARILAIDGQWWRGDLFARLRWRLGRILESWSQTGRLSPEEALFDQYYRPEIRAALPLLRGEQPERVADVFRQAGLTRVQHCALPAVTRAEQAVLPFRRRLLYQERFLVAGWVEPISPSDHGRG